MNQTSYCPFRACNPTWDTLRDALRASVSWLQELTVALIVMATVATTAHAQLWQPGSLPELTPGQTKAVNALWGENPLSVQFRSSKTIVVAEIKGPAEITMMHFAFARTQLGQDSAKPLSQQVGNGAPLTRDLLLRIYWNDETTPSVDVPLVDFFCDPDGREDLVNTAFVNVDRGFNAYFLMPFLKSAKVELVYQGPIPPGAELARRMPCYSYVCYRTLKAFPQDAGYFCASWRQESLLLGSREYEALETEGRGKFIGWNVAIHSLYTNGFPVDENEKFYIDGEEKPAIEFQGLEDSYGFSWGYPKEANMFPYTGYLPFLNGAIGYRFFVQDAISFDKSLKVVIGFGATEEHFRKVFSRPDTKVQISTTVYWYQAHPNVVMPLIPPVDQREPILKSVYSGSGN